MGREHDQTKRRRSRLPTIHLNRNDPHQAIQSAMDAGNHQPSASAIHISIFAHGSFSRQPRDGSYIIVWNHPVAAPLAHAQEKHQEEEEGHVLGI